MSKQRPSRPADDQHVLAGEWRCGAAHDAQAREQRADDRQARHEVIGDRARDPRRVGTAKDVEAQDRRVERKKARMVRDEDRGPARRDALGTARRDRK
jgi:hypothetical protein